MIAAKPAKPASAPTAGTKPQSVQLSQKHIDELIESGLTQEQALATNHRTVNAKEAKRCTGHEIPGLLFTYTDPTTGKPFQMKSGKWARRSYCRLKPDWSKARAGQVERYSDDEGNLPKYLSPAKCGSRPYFSDLLDWKKVLKRNSIPLTITEGEKKGDSGCAAGMPTIALSGVSAFVDRDDRGEWFGSEGSAWDCEEPDDEDRQSRFLPELDTINWKYRPVGVVFDSDIIHKFSVEKSLETLLSHIYARVGKGFPVLIPYEMSGVKNGLDDFIFRHGADAFQKIWDAFHHVQSTQNKMVTVKPGKKGGAPVYSRELDEEEQEGKLKRLYLELKEPPPHVKAVMTWAVLKETWAYRPSLGWYRWNGKCWAIAGDPMELSRDIGTFFDAQNWQNVTEGHYAHAQAEMGRRTLVAEDRWNQQHKISFQNGTLDTQTNEFHPHRREDFITNVLPYDYNPVAKCPHWLQFIHSATGGDEQLQALMRAWFRWILTPKDRRFKFPVEKSLDLIGRKGSGKGTFLDALLGLIGEENYATASPDTFNTPEGLGQLLDKRLAVDTDASGYMSGVGNFNKVVSNEPVGVKKLFKDKTAVRLGIVIVRSYNDFISVPSSGTEGLDRRLCLLPFNHPPSNPDYTLSDKLRDELPGIFAWAWSMPLAVAKSVILWSGSIKAVQNASMDRFANDHPEYRFLLDYYPEGTTSIQAFDLYTRYAEWAKNNGHKACSNTKFGILMSELGITPRKGNGGCNFYTIPNMEEKFDLVGYLRIAPGDAEQMPLELRPKTTSIPEPVPVSEGSEGFGGSENRSNPEPVSISEGSEGFGGSSPPAVTLTDSASPSPGDIVVISASASRYKYGGSELPYSVPEELRAAETCAIGAMPPKVANFICGDSEVLNVSEDGTLVRVCRLGNEPFVSWFDVEMVRVLKRRES